MLNNVKDFGACGNDSNDDREAIQEAIKSAVRYKSQSGIYFPAGTYRVSRVDVPESGGCSLELNGVVDFMVKGDGPRSVVKLMDRTETTGPAVDWHVFLLYNDCERVVFQDLYIDGNRPGLANVSEHCSGIQVDSGTLDLVVDRCIIRDCFGDGMRLLRSTAAQHKVKRLRIENCLFQTNKRSGIAIQRGIEQIIIANCIFDANISDNSIDFEPSSTAMPTDLVIQGCIINHTNPTKAVHLSGKSDGEPVVRCKFSDNIVIGGPIFCLDFNQLAIQNNIVTVSFVPPTQIVQPTHVAPIEVHLGGDSALITGNLIVTEHNASEAAISIKGNRKRPLTRALVSNNLCFARSGSGIHCSSGNDIAIQGNMIVADGACASGIFLRSESGPMDHIAIRDNDVTIKGTGNWGSGVRIASHESHQIGHVSVVGNSIRASGKGVQFENDNFTQTPICALNRVADDVKRPLVIDADLPAGKSLIVGGATSRGGEDPDSGAGRFIVGKGDPNEVVIGNVGDIFQRLDGPPALYVKEAGESTGWIPK